MDSFLIKQEAYLEAGVHIGTKLKVVDMNQFIYRMRNDGLYVLDLRKIDERIRLAGKLLSQYTPEEILVVASRTYSGNAASVFSQLTGIKVFQGRFIPGILTNVFRKDFLEPKLLLVCDPKGEHQAVIEAGNMGITTIGLCDSDNSTTFIDWVVPCNNKGRRSLALLFYLFSREYLMGRNRIASYDEFSTPLSSFETEKPAEDAASAAAVQAAAGATAPAESAAASVQVSPAHSAEKPSEPQKAAPAPAEAPAESSAPAAEKPAGPEKAEAVPSGEKHKHPAKNEAPKEEKPKAE